MNNLDRRINGTRQMINLIAAFGEVVNRIPNEGVEVFDLRGAGRLETKQYGLRKDYRIVARGAEFQASSWRGQLENPVIVRGDDKAFNRVLKNAEKMGRQVETQRKEAEMARLAQVAACCPAR